MSSFPYGDPADRMAEFNAIVTASFDDIGSTVALDRIPQVTLRPNRLVSQPPPSSATAAATDKCSGTRRSPFSFLRKVKSHATSLLLSSQPKLDQAPPTSFVPSPPTGTRSRPRAPTPVPFASSLPRNLFTRALGKHHHTPDNPHLGPQNSFFDDDDDDHVVDRPVYPQRRRISSALARSNSRLSSAFAAAPVLLGLSSQSVSTPYLIAEKNDVAKPEFRPDLAHVCTFFAPAFTVAHVFLFYEIPAAIQTVSGTQASYEVIPPKVDVTSLPFLFPVNRSFSSHTILPFSPLLHCFHRL
jgi:hypothetical protein